MRTALLLSFVGFVSLTTSASAENCRAAAYPVSIDDNYDHTAWIDADRLDEGDILVRFGGFTAMYDGPDDDDGNSDTPNLVNETPLVRRVHSHGDSVKNDTRNASPNTPTSA